MKSPDSPGRFTSRVPEPPSHRPDRRGKTTLGRIRQPVTRLEGNPARARAAGTNGNLAFMTYELDPQTPDEFDGDITSTLDSGLAGTAGYHGRSNGIPPRVGDLSDLTEDDKRLYDEFLATLR